MLPACTDRYRDKIKLTKKMFEAKNSDVHVESWDSQDWGRRTGVQSQPELHSKLHSILGYVTRLYLKKKKKNQVKWVCGQSHRCRLDGMPGESGGWHRLREPIELNTVPEKNYCEAMKSNKNLPSLALNQFYFSCIFSSCSTSPQS